MIAPKSIYIAFEAFPRPKGASAHIASMLAAMTENFPPVLLLCLGFGDMPAFQTEENIMIKRFKEYHPNMLKRSTGFGQFVIDSIENYGQYIELCVFRDPWGGAPALSCRYNFKMIFEVNALPSWELGYTYPGFSKNYPLKNKIEGMEYFCLENSDEILTVSPVTSKALSQKGINSKKITVIPNSAPDIFFEAPGNIPMPGCLETGRWIGYFGSLHPWQGVEDAVKAFSMISSDFPEVGMVIITGGRKEVKKKIRKLIRKQNMEQKIMLHPPMTPDKLAATITGLEFTLAPLRDTMRNTRQGCCPIKIIESMAAGVPVIASDLSCVRYLIQHNHDGYLFQTGNTRALALSIRKLLIDKKKTKELSGNAKSTALTRFSRKKIHEALDKLFHGEKFSRTAPVRSET